jgi:hypothetical protein
MKAWSAMRHLLGEATDLPDLLQRAVDSDPDCRRHARFGLRERLVDRAHYTSAAPRVVQELISEVLAPETPDIAGLLELLAEIAAADADRLAWQPADGPPDDRNGREVWSALDLRSIELGELAVHADPTVRAQAMRLISLAVPDAPLPEHDDDPAVEATLALAHARRGTALSDLRPLSRLLADLWREPPTGALLDTVASALDTDLDPQRFPWAGGDLDACIEALVLRNAEPADVAAVFARAIVGAPDHPRVAERSRRVATHGFPDPIDARTPALDAHRRAWADAILVPGRPHALPGLPSRAIDARRVLGLDPKGPLEAETDEGPLWAVLSGVPSAALLEQLSAIGGLPAALQRDALIETLFGGHDLEPAPADALEPFLDQDPAWAVALLERIARTPPARRPWGRGSPPHANVARLALAHHGIPLPDGAPPIAFADAATRVHRVLQALAPEGREAALLGWMTDPDRPDFQEAEVLEAVLPHLADHARLVGPVLHAGAALLARVHRSPDVERILVAAWAWCAQRDADATNAWQARLSNEEQTRLAQAVEAVAPTS